MVRSVTGSPRLLVKVLHAHDVRAAAEHRRLLLLRLWSLLSRLGGSERHQRNESEPHGTRAKRETGHWNLEKQRSAGTPNSDSISPGGVEPFYLTPVN